ncbi:MAG: hypothetical protein JWO18_2853 [Microbacteriaceae bacterium]|jgi:hypothetical protein|nr:hypothetical protein [Microbacteriaceae bacterium]
MANCTKIKYPNRWVATHALQAIALKNAHCESKYPVAIHPCELCHAWHLTSQKQHGKKSRKWNVLVR